MKKQFAAIIVILLFSFFVLRPLAKPGFFVSDDGDWMIIRLSAFYQSFREGQFPVRFLGRLNQSYGYPVANFLYPGYLYVGSLIHATGLPFVQTTKLILSISIIMAGFGCLLWLRSFFPPGASLMGALSLIGSSYLLYDLYKRGSVGEILAIATFSWILALWEKKQWLLVTFLIGFLIIAHNTLALLFLFFFIVYTFVRERPKGALPFFGALGLSAFFWIPAILDKRFVVFDQIAISNPAQYFLPVVGWSLLSVVLVTGFFASVFLTKPTRIRNFCIVLFLIVLFLSTPISSLLWGKGALTTLVQFPYRFLSLSLFSGAFLVAYTLSSLLPVHRLVLSVVTLGVLLIESNQIISSVIPTNKAESFYTTNEATTTVSGEYMPVWVKEPAPERATGRFEFYQGKGSYSLSLQSTQKVVGTVVAEEDSIVQLNSVFYPGWGITIDGVPAKIDYENPRGVIRVPISKGTHTIMAEFHETIIRFVADIVSVISFVFIVVLSLPFVQKLNLASIRKFWRRDQEGQPNKIRRKKNS